ncbi:MAG: hypothetical protein NTZ05_08365, partial [Chloroflexi bacterium]|nr:hypothetical protein [Chloroflexota bacterium]
MSVTTRFGFGLLGAATALGVLGDLLLRVAPWGVNAALWIACLIVGVVGLARWQGRPLGAGLGLLAVTLFFALLLAGRDSAVLAFLAIIAVLALLGLAPLGTGIARLASSGLADNVWRLMLAGFNACVGPLPVLLNDIRWPEVRGGARLQAAFPALRGVVLTAPLLLIFGALFASADANFAHAVGQLFNWDIDDAVLHLLFAGFWAWIVAGGLSYLFMETGEFSLSGKLRGLVSVGVTEIGIALAALDALFLAFVVVQTPY